MMTGVALLLIKIVSLFFEKGGDFMKNKIYDDLIVLFSLSLDLVSLSQNSASRITY